MRSLYAAPIAILVVALLASGNVGPTGRSNAGNDDELSRLKKDLSELQDAFAKFKVANTHNEGLISNLSRTSPPVGSVLAFAGAWPPKDSKGKQWTEDELGWVLADGRELEAFKHTELIAVIGSKQLPNYCGLFLRGIDSKLDGSLAGRDKDGKRLVNHVQEWATGMPKNAFSTGGAGHFSFDDRVITGPNIDDAKLNRWPQFGRGAAGQTPAISDFRAPAINKLSVSQPDHTHGVGGGDPESRPINAAVHWIIKFR